MRLETERLLLRPFEPRDAPSVEREVSRVEIARMIAVPHPYPKGGAARWVATTKPGRDFAIELRETGETVGAVTINVHEQYKRASLGYWCAVAYWGRGYATEAVRAVLDYGFRELALNRIHADCHGDNPASRRVLEKAGMTYEGRLRQHSFRLGRFADKLQFGILRSEWSAGVQSETSWRRHRPPISSATMARIGDLMTRDVLAVAPEDTLGEAAQKMVERGVGSAVVTDFGRLIGILTERDLMRATAGRTHSSEARVREWMTADPITVSEETAAEEAAQTMLEHGFRHLPVISAGRAVGIVSIRDVAEWGMQSRDE